MQVEAALTTMRRLDGGQAAGFGGSLDKCGAQDKGNMAWRLMDAGQLSALLECDPVDKLVVETPEVCQLD